MTDNVRLKVAGIERFLPREFGAVLRLLLPVAAAFLSSAHGESKSLTIDKEGRKVTVQGKVAKQNIYAELKGAIEYIACCPGGKVYESLFICPVEPRELRHALMKVGLKPGKSASDEGDNYHLPEGDLVRLWVSWKDGEKNRRERVESFVIDRVTKKNMAPIDWTFTGSKIVKDPQTGENVLEASLVKNLVSLHHLDHTVLFQNPTLAGRQDNRYEANIKTLPKEGTPVIIEFEVAASGKAAPVGSVKRIHWLIIGNVQGVGFRTYTQRHARRFKVKGWVRNLPTGQVEFEASGPADAMSRFESKVRKGPRGSKVESVKEIDKTNGLLTVFEIRPTPDQ